MILPHSQNLAFAHARMGSNQNKLFPQGGGDRHQPINLFRGQESRARVLNLEWSLDLPHNILALPGEPPFYRFAEAMLDKSKMSVHG